MTLANLVDYSRAHNARFVLVRPDTQLLATLRAYGTLDTIGEDNIFPTSRRPSTRSARRRHRSRRGGNPHLADADPAA